MTLAVLSPIYIPPSCPWCSFHSSFALSFRLPSSLTDLSFLPTPKKTRVFLNHAYLFCRWSLSKFILPSVQIKQEAMPIKILFKNTKWIFWQRKKKKRRIKYRSRNVNIYSGKRVYLKLTSTNKIAFGIYVCKLVGFCPCRSVCHSLWPSDTQWSQL